jgi:4-amino-4-deoxy-L-arabinose transferase-like glycosyltransferase
VAGESYFASALLNIACGTATAVLVLLLATSLLGASVGRWAGLLAAVYPNHVLFGSLHLTEPLFTLFLVAAVFLLLFTRRPATAASLVGAGLLLGLAVLTRPAIALFPLLLPVWYLGQGHDLRTALKRGGAVVLVSFLVIVPWMARNYRVSGRAHIASSGGHNFWIGNNPKALGGYARPVYLDRPLWDGEKADFSRGYRLGLEAIAAEPVRAAFRFVQKTTYFFALETDGVLWNMKGFSRPPTTWITVPLLGLTNPSYIAVLGACVLGFLSGPGGAFSSLFGLLTAYFVMITVAFVGDPRYHYPLVPLAAILAGKALVHDWPALRSGLTSTERSTRASALKWAAIMSVFAVLMVANLYLKVLEATVLRRWAHRRVGESPETFESGVAQSPHNGGCWRLWSG